MNEQVINQIISFGINVIFPIGILYVILKEYKTIYTFIQKNPKDLKILNPLLIRLLYPLGGFVLLFFSFSLTNFIITFIVPTDLPNPEMGTITDIWSSIRYNYGYVGVILFVGLILSSFSLMVSAGDRFFVNLSKILATLSVIYVIVATVIAYA